MKIYSSSSGFSLVEVLVSITILLMVIVGPMTMISRANSSTAFATEQINAWFLAQEGLELIQKQREDYFLTYFQDPVGSTNPNPWADFTDASPTGKLRFCYTAAGCDVLIGNGAAPTISVANCATLANCRLSLDSSSAVRQNYTRTGTASLFTRVITMVRINADQVKVTTTVTWQTRNIAAPQSVVVSTYLFNVYDTP